MKSAGSTKRKKQRNIVLAQLPMFCDFGCTYATFPPVDAAGACRREQAVYCTALKKYNNKNNRCLARTGDGK
jgi:hypothetical protein